MGETTYTVFEARREGPRFGPVVQVLTGDLRDEGSAHVRTWVVSARDKREAVSRARVQKDLNYRRSF